MYFRPGCNWNKCHNYNNLNSQESLTFSSSSISNLSAWIQWYGRPSSRNGFQASWWSPASKLLLQFPLLGNAQTSLVTCSAVVGPCCNVQCRARTVQYRARTVQWRAVPCCNVVVRRARTVLWLVTWRSVQIVFVMVLLVLVVLGFLLTLSAGGFRWVWFIWTRWWGSGKVLAG